MALQRRKSARMVRDKKSVAVVTDPKTPSEESGHSQDTTDSTASNSPIGSEEERMSTDQSAGKKWFASVTSSSSTFIQKSVDRWFEIYQVDAEIAFAKLLQYVIHFSGFTAELRSPQLKETNVQVQLNSLSRYTRSSGCSLKLPNFPPEVARMSLFINSFVKQNHDKLLSSSLYTTCWYHWIVQMSESPIINFRQGSTFICLKLITALNGKLRQMRQNLSSAQSQEHQSSTNSSSHESERMVEITYEMIKMLEKAIEKRFFDSESLIRLLCLMELKDWIEKFADIYFRKKYLDHTKMLLSDKNIKVQLECLNVIEKMVTNLAQDERCKQFLSQILDQLLGISFIREGKVAARNIIVLFEIYKNFSDLFEPDDLSTLHMGVFSRDSLIAKASSRFLMHHLKTFHDERQLVTESGRNIDPDAMILVNLAKFCESLEFDKKARYLANCLVDYHPIFCNWQTYVDLLGESFSVLDITLQMKLMISDLLLHFVKRCVLTPKDNYNAKKDRLSAAEKKLQQLNSSKITAVLIRNLEGLLEKHLHDSNIHKRIMANLIKTVQYFNPETLSQNLKLLNELLFSVNGFITETSSNIFVMTAYSKAYRSLAQSVTSVQNCANSHFSALITSLIGDFKTEYDNSPCLSTIEKFSKNLLICNRFHDLSSFSVWDDVYAVYFTSHSDLIQDEDFANTFIYGCRDYLLWLLLKYSQETDLNLMQNQIFTFFYFLRNLQQHKLFRLRQMAFNHTCDMLICFSQKLENCQGCIRNLIFLPDSSTIKNLCQFMDDDLAGRLIPNMTANEPQVEVEQALTAFAKLIIYGALSAEHSHHLLSLYEKMKWLKMDDVIAKVIQSVVESNDWGKAIASTFLNIHLSSGEEVTKEFALEFFKTLSSKKRQQKSAAGTQVLVMLIQVMLVVSDLSRKESQLKVAFLFELMPSFVEMLDKEKHQILKRYIEENQENLLKNISSDYGLQKTNEFFSLVVEKDDRLSVSLS